jgi:hypothetical protein
MRPANTPSAQSPKLLGQGRERIRIKHYSIRTETQYVRWAGRFVLYHGKRHPSDMGTPEIGAFLTHLAADGRVETLIYSAFPARGRTPRRESSTYA